MFGNLFGSQKWNARMEQNAAGCGQEAAECGQDAEEFGAGQEYPLPLYGFLTEIWQDILQKRT